MYGMYVYVKLVCSCDVYVLATKFASYKSKLPCRGGLFIKDGDPTQWMMPLILLEKYLDLQLPSITHKD